LASSKCTVRIKYLTGLPRHQSLCRAFVLFNETQLRYTMQVVLASLEEVAAGSHTFAKQSACVPGTEDANWQR